MAKVLAYALGAFGLAYACLWWSYDQFYGHFKVSPQDVGLSPTGNVVDLTSAALQLGIWLVILIAIMAAVPTLAVAAIMFAKVRPKKGDKWRRWLFVIGAGLVVCSVLLYVNFVETWPGPVLIVCAFAAVVAIEHFRRTESDGGGSSAPKGDDLPPPPTGLARLESASGVSLRPAVAVFLTAAVIGIALLDLPSDADEAGTCASTLTKKFPYPRAVTDLNAPIPLPGLHLPILNVRAQPARLTWVSGDHERISSRVIYLGQSNGTVLVYGKGAGNQD